MKTIVRNTGYFFKEIKTMIKLDFFSNLFSIISLGFILFILSLIIAGGWGTNYMIEAIEDEAEISVYYTKDSQVSTISEKIRSIDGVREVIEINAAEAKEEISEIMGEESRILELFEHNPFSPYIEVKIDLDFMDTVADEVKKIEGVELVRDNKEILDKLKGISSLANILGALLVIAVSVATLVITSHIIRQGIYMNKEQINTLRLLGAPEGFINLPFILEGIIMTILAGFLSMSLIFIVFKYISSKLTVSLPFLILPDAHDMLLGMGAINLILSLVLGLVGSLFGLKSTKK
jgi:cell division transport system permease protein